jgi:2,4-dienoyl-CoA reductase-like NADH-dependent reductase (Old Yellow Enzyme family)
VGPSGPLKGGEQRTEPMTQQQIDFVVNAFAQGAADAKFDAVQIHGAHGYLIDQFFWKRTNRRTDIYGGDLVKRTRFAVEIIEGTFTGTKREATSCRDIGDLLDRLTNGEFDLIGALLADGE